LATPAIMTPARSIRALLHEQLIDSCRRVAGLACRRERGADCHGWIFPCVNLGKYQFIRTRLCGHPQQIDDVGFAFKRPRIGLHEAMIDGNLANLVKLVFADPNVGKAAG
jgi:hypothetical protein